MKSKTPCLSWMLLLIFLSALALVAVAVFVPLAARQDFGEPSPALNIWQQYNYGVDLVWNARNITQARDPAGVEQLFIIQSGESVTSISTRLEQAGLILNANTFRNYLLWAGLDTIIQTGTYRISPAQTGLDIAQMLKSTTLTEVNSQHPAWLADGRDCRNAPHFRDGISAAGISGCCGQLPDRSGPFSTRYLSRGIPLPGFIHPTAHNNR